MNNQPTNSSNPEKWVEKYADDLFAWTFQRTGKRTLAEDLVKDTFLTALDSIENLKTENNEKIWLFSILRSKMLIHYHEAFIKSSIEENLSFEDAKTELFSRTYFDLSGNWIKDSRPVNWHSEEENLPEDGEFMSILKMCLKLLPEKGYSLMILLFNSERQTSEIRSDLNIIQPNLWALLHQAKLQLRACIEENWLND
jgi:RNA polymerase sigma-70 factor (ECF subfamily)